MPDMDRVQPFVAWMVLFIRFTFRLFSTKIDVREECLSLYFKERLKSERELKGWSQSELADKLHVSRQSISKWETGKSFPNIELIIQLSDLFGITIDDFLRSDERLENKIIDDSKNLAYPNLKKLFEALLILGGFFIMIKWFVLGVNTYMDTDIYIHGVPSNVSNYLPLGMATVGWIGGSILSKKYK